MSVPRFRAESRMAASHDGDPLSICFDVSFRRCRESDLAALEWHGLFTAHRRIIRMAFLRQKRGRNLMLVADANGLPIGQIWIDWTRSRRPSTAMFWAFRVLPWFQGRGIGVKLLEFAEETVRRKKFRAVELGVEKHNLRAARLYERLGYKRVGELKEEFWSVQPDGRRIRHKLDEWLMRKQLEAPSVLGLPATDLPTPAKPALSDDEVPAPCPGVSILTDKL